MPVNKPLSALERATAAHHAGNLAEAERLYLAALRSDAGNVDLLYQLSVLCAQTGRFEEALRHAERAIGLSPGVAQLHLHRAELLNALHQIEPAVEAYRQALAIDQDHVDALNGLGDSLIALKRAAEALPILERAIALKPDHVPALNNRANALQLLGRREEALRGFDRALAFSPGNPYVLSNRASTLLSLKRFAEAEADSRAALAQDPRYVGAMFNLGKAQLRQNNHAAALATFDQLLAMQPGNAAAWCDKGSVYANMRRYKEAWACFDKSLALDPNLVDAWYASAVLYSSLSKHEAALECFRRVLTAQPDNAEAACSLGETLRARGRDEEAILAFEDALRADPDWPNVIGQIAWLKMHRCNWQGVESDIEAMLSALRSGKQVAPPLDVLTLSDSGADQLRCARLHAEDRYKPSAGCAWQGARYRNPRIKLAYVSADFRDHPVSYLIAGLIEQHDRSRFEVLGYSLAQESATPLALRMQRAFDGFTVVDGLSDDEVARLLKEQQIDIAIDLMGPTAHSRGEIYARRPCPVQVNYLGYPGTVGTECLDYIVADAYVIPPGSERHYAEKVVRLPDTYQCNDSKRDAAPGVLQRADVGLPQSGIVYCCFNNSAKFSPAVFALWMRVLHEVPGSVLWLFADNAVLQDNLRREAQARGIEASRLFFAPAVKHPEHLRRARLADVFLDTLPFNAGTNASDALWAGVPVVTRSGEAFAARMGGSLLHAVGMPELITRTPEEYVALAVRLGNDPAFLAATKAKLAANRATKPLFDTDRFRRHLEAAYVAMWERYQRGEPPDHITVAPVA
jgi:predicted O-linked N-acetylglucosamine transferase (SPINDLY family)